MGVMTTNWKTSPNSRGMVHIIPKLTAKHFEAYITTTRTEKVVTGAMYKNMEIKNQLNLQLQPNTA